MAKIVARNRKAKHLYHIENTYEAGIVLLGTEVKSARAGRISIKESYARFFDGELYLVNSHISAYKNSSIFNHDEKRMRKLLLKKSELQKLHGKVTQKGYTLIPLKAYFTEKKLLKISIALAKGKNIRDRREEIKKRDIKRDMNKALKDKKYER